MAQSFRNRAALSGYIAREVKSFFDRRRKKLRTGFLRMLRRLSVGLRTHSRTTATRQHRQLFLTLNSECGVMTMTRKFVSLAIIAVTLILPALASAQPPRYSRACTKCIGLLCFTCQTYCPLRRVAGGDVADCRGWRFVNGHWNSSCLNLDYLPSQYACSPNGYH